MKRCCVQNEIGDIPSLHWLGTNQAICILLTLLFLSFPSTACAQQSGDFQYYENGDTIILTRYTGPSGNVTLPDRINGLPVTGIANGMFEMAGSPTNVTIPANVSSIEDNAFAFCASLTTITVNANNGYFSSVDGILFDKAETRLIRFPPGQGGGYAIPPSVTEIGDYAFVMCTNLTSVRIPANVTHIGIRAFESCTRLTTITVNANNIDFASVDGVLFDKAQKLLIQFPAGRGGAYAVPAGVTEIGDYAFLNCPSLASVTLPDSLTHIGDYAFYDCAALTRASLPGRVATIGVSAFRCTDLTNVTFPDSLTTLEHAAFAGCTALTQVTIPGSVTTVETGAFVECIALVKVTISNGVTNIEDGAFASCPSLIRVTMPDTVTSIGSGAFQGCSSLASFTIPDSVIHIGDGTFQQCTNLTAITVNPNNLAYTSRDGVLFDKAETSLLQFPGGVGGSYLIPNTVTNIRDGAFTGCCRLTRVTIPDRVASIGDNAFKGCPHLTAITVDANNASYSSRDGVLFNKAETSLLQCPGGASGSYVIPDTVTHTRNEAFEECSRLTDVTIPDRVASIGIDAFTECTDLVRVTIGNGVTVIGMGAFSNCRRLASVSIPASVARIDMNAFGDCDSLTAIAVDPNNPCYSSRDGVLFNKSQTSLLQCPGGVGGSYVIPNTVTSIGESAFANCTNLTQVTIPDSVSNIVDQAFTDCLSLNSVTIGRGVTYLWETAFLYCTNLESVFCRGNAPGWGPEPFYGDSNATVYYLPGTAGWGQAFAGRPSQLWDPALQVSRVGANGLGLNITGTPNIPIVLEATTNLLRGPWVPLESATLTNGLMSFHDPDWTHQPARFYRIRSP